MTAVALALAALALAALLWLATGDSGYWRRRRVAHARPWPLVGNSLEAFLLRKTAAQYAHEVYRRFNGERVAGFYKGTRPELYLLDPELVRRVLVRDALTHFHSRGMLPHKKVVQPLFRNLFFLEGDAWKLLRQRLTPMFTSGKLRAMFPLIAERAEKLQARALASAAGDAALDSKELLARYATDFIGACGFGVESDSLNDDHSEFRKLGQKIFAVRVSDLLKFLLKEMFPELLKHVRIRTELEGDMREFVTAVLKKRDYQPIGRGDFVDLLLEGRKLGTIYGESIERFVDGVPAQASMEFDDDVILGQMFVFFAAGFETSSSASSFTLHQLAFHPEAQAKARAEVDAVLARHGGRLSYAAIKEMTYLEWCLKEGLRLFPPLGVLTRECANAYRFPEIDLTIDAGVKVMIPVIGFHKDPKYFKEPEAFRPERFHPDEFGALQRQLYLPFGDGPRNCIGARLGLMQSVAGLAAILAAFSVHPAPETRRHPPVNTRSLSLQTVKGGLPLLFRERTA